VREREEKMFLLVGMERKYDFLYICLELCSLLTVLLVFDFLDGCRKYYITKYMNFQITPQMFILIVIS